MQLLCNLKILTYYGVILTAHMVPLGHVFTNLQTGQVLLVMNAGLKQQEQIWGKKKVTSFSTLRHCYRKNYVVDKKGKIVSFTGD